MLPPMNSILVQINSKLCSGEIFLCMLNFCTSPVMVIAEWTLTKWLGHVFHHLMTLSAPHAINWVTLLSMLSCEHGTSSHDSQFTGEETLRIQTQAMHFLNLSLLKHLYAKNIFLIKYCTIGLNFGIVVSKSILSPIGSVSRYWASTFL